VFVGIGLYHGDDGRRNGAATPDFCRFLMAVLDELTNTPICLPEELRYLCGQINLDMGNVDHFPLLFRFRDASKIGPPE
jgi:hypothetical protein